MFFHVCKILWRRISRSSRDNWLLKKVLGRYERCILRWVTPWNFWQKSEPFDTGRNVDQKQQKKLLFWVFGWTFLFKLLLFLNELSYRYQIGLKLKLIHSIFKKYSEENFFSSEYHIWHEENLFLNQNSDQELFHCSRNTLRYQMSISTKVFLKTASKYLPSETNLMSIAQDV